MSVAQGTPVSESGRAELASLADRRNTAQALRARIVLACADGAKNKLAAARLGVRENTVGKWRRRAIALRLRGLTMSQSLGHRGASTTRASS